MPQSQPPQFPHLELNYRGQFEPKFNGGSRVHPDVQRVLGNRVGHSQMLLGRVTYFRQFDQNQRDARRAAGLPEIPAGRTFVLRIPERVDADELAHQLGIELVSETQSGFVLMATENLALSKLEDVLRKFLVNSSGGGSSANILDIYERPDDERKLNEVLDDHLRPLWPFDDTTLYTVDIGIQTAQSSREIKFPNVRQRNNETEQAFEARRSAARLHVWTNAEDNWTDNAQERIQQLDVFIRAYAGEALSGMMNQTPRANEVGVVFPDSVQIRIRINGQGLRDIVQNFPHIFEVTVPPDVELSATQMVAVGTRDEIVIETPLENAPTVCIIDSGIQEEHRWLQPAIDSNTSRSFLPGSPSDDIADKVSPQGHGTRVAGAVLYPGEVPKQGTITPVAWLQNARVLNERCDIPEALLPEKYLTQVIEHFNVAPRLTKIYNHSINGRTPCPCKRMTAWAAKIDQLSHERDVLFIQSAGNITPGAGDQSNPGLDSHLNSGRSHPEQLLEDSSRIANPGQALHALTVGSITAEILNELDARSFSQHRHGPSGFSRAGYGQPWSVVKPEVVEVGGDLIHSPTRPHNPRADERVSVELLNSTLENAPAYSRDGVGTSFATSKVSHIAAHLQSLFPNASPLLYRALIVQSARWPTWAEREPDADKILRLIGYGIPSVERATNNTEHRITYITNEAVEIPSKQYHLYVVKIPEELRSPAQEARIRIDVTLAYTALPRRTRARHRGYLETWLDWESSKLGESLADFKKRMEEGGESEADEFGWTLHKRNNWGVAEETNRSRGSAQKDWAEFDAYNLPEEFAIAVRAHAGWNHRPGAAKARYCLAVSFEATGMEVPIYSLMTRVEIEAETRIQ